MSWIVGTRTAGDQASKRRCLIPLAKITMIEEGHGGGIVVHLEGQMPETLTEPGFEEIEAQLGGTQIMLRGYGEEQGS